ncbi:hypothetical protein VSAK1_09148 [Vibrio mediterranei AK1]|uniref:hypothetical protein n=1 Tax=Vibrio mediterranei TaxID=689 RepID=UPI0001542877|nr:hypothetical protein [Vibrio mediterranei]EDL51448.1 hypothetical protein VSAK1_09148 [Vibrio mediterranei AK1]
MSISLKKAYSACLWLAERKLGIPVEEQRGEWDLEAKDKAFNWKREELVTALPYEYFENSIYDYHDELHQASEVTVQLDDLDIDEPKVSKVSGENDLELLQDTWESISKQVFTDLHQSDDDQDDDTQYIHCIDVSNIASGNLFINEKLDNFVRYSPQRQYGDTAPVLQDIEIAETVPHAPQAFIYLDDPIPTEHDKRAIANVIAHNTLLDLLSSDVFKASGYRDITSIKETLTQAEHIGYSTEDIPASFWEAKPIPNYEISAVEQGVNRISKINSVLPLDIPVNERFKLQKNDYWIKNIQISDNFASWLMDRVRVEFPIPEKVTFKPEGKNFLVQFGTDKRTTVRNSKGMSLLYKILKEYRKSSYSMGSGYSTDEIEQDIQHELGMSTKKLNTKHGYEEKLRNEFYNLLSRYFETDDWDEKLDLASSANKLLSQINDINGIDIFTQDYLKEILKKDTDWFIKHGESLKLSSKIDEAEETKEIDSLRKNLENALDKLKASCPHFAYYLGSLASKKALGLGYSKENEEFYFICDDDIEWDFG